MRSIQNAAEDYNDDDDDDDDDVDDIGFRSLD